MDATPANIAPLQILPTAKSAAGKYCRWFLPIDRNLLSSKTHCWLLFIFVVSNWFKRILLAI